MSESKLSLESGTIKVVGHPPEVKAHNLLPENHPTYALIGRVAAEWARLEHKLDVMIWNMAKLRFNVGSCITGQMLGHYPRFNAIIALGAIGGLSDDLLCEIEKLQQSTSNLAKDRNRIIHDAWFMETDTKHVTQFRSVLPNKKVSGFVDIDEQEVHKLLSRITRKVDAISKIWTKITNGLQSSS